MSVQEKKPFPEDRAAKLALAREKALEAVTYTHLTLPTKLAV